mgnify:CR=1 FL=1
MQGYQWPYDASIRDMFLARMAFAEQLLQSYGAEYIDTAVELGTWMLRNGCYAYERLEKRIWKRKNVYIRVDRVYFPEKPFIVLEFSQKQEGPYEDADPFPYDLPDEEFEQEVWFALGFV